MSRKPIIGVHQIDMEVCDICGVDVPEDHARIIPTRGGRWSHLCDVCYQDIMDAYNQIKDQQTLHRL